MIGSQSEEQAYELYTGAKALLKMGAFNLHKFSTNSCSLQARVNMEEVGHRDDPSVVSESAETFSQVTLGRSQGTRDGEQKVGVTLVE